MTENGPIPDPAACFAADAPWSWFMSWSNLVNEQNSAGHLQDVYDDTMVITLESADLPAVYEWRSSLYPEDWKPGYTDKQGRFLHDFSFAGYKAGETAIPRISGPVVDITKAPYQADRSGTDDVTAIIQQALDDVGSSGGGVVYLPAGTYRIKAPASGDYALRIRYDSTVLRGAGPDSTFLFHDETFLRQKNIIEVYGQYAGWRHSTGVTSPITADLTEPTRILPVKSVEGFTPGDLVVVRATPTEAFMEEHGMGGIWTPDAFEGLAFLRRIDSVDVEKNVLIIDAPTRYTLKTRDTAIVTHAGKHITECGIEDLSVGNRENPKEGWDEETYNTEGTGAWDVHFSHVIQFRYGLNCWVKNVHTYKPAGNTRDVHILSNGLSMVQSRFITVDSCDFEKPQYEGGGGNGYMYTLEGNDCLITNSRGNDGRHNFDFKFPYSNGNVIQNCRAEHSKYASDFHMYLSMANLFDHCTVNGDFLESVFRPYGGDAIHGYSSTQSVFYNTVGEAYHPGNDCIVDSRQFGWGYVIGTSGPADAVNLTPVSGTLNGYSFDTWPEDMLEGEGRGEGLSPVSLYDDQLARRLARPKGPARHDVTVMVMDEAADTVLPGSRVIIYNDTLLTDAEGKAAFSAVYESFILSAEKDYYEPVDQKQIVVPGDTMLTVRLKRQEFRTTITVLDARTHEPFAGLEVDLGQNRATTDDLGAAEFRVGAGPNPYSISLGSYRPEEGTLIIVSDTAFTLSLTRTAAMVIFRVKSDTAFPGGATVRLEGDSLMTDATGQAEFTSLPVDSGYHYLVRRDEYDTKEGFFNLVTDTTIEITLQRLPTGIRLSSTTGGIRIWPNPAEGVISGSPENFSGPGRVKIWDLRGNAICVQDIETLPFSVDLKGLSPGMYILQWIAGEAPPVSGCFVKSP